MNKQIELLARQAGAAVQPGGELLFFGNTSIEKFAQLIVAHATECVRDVLREEDSGLTYAAAGQVQNRIKEYFGVEE